MDSNAPHRRIGIYGGTFNPVHLGHLIIAEQCREQARLDEVWFVPAARPPHKNVSDLAAFSHRAEMLGLAIAGHSAFHVDTLEQERPGPSYTVESLETLHQRHPHDEFFLLIGSDCLPDLPQWRAPARIAELAGLLVVPRPAWPIWTDEQLRAAMRLTAPLELRHQVVHAPLIEISSRELRRKVAQRRTVRYLVPRAVECYMEAHRLYQPTVGDDENRLLELQERRP